MGRRSSPALGTAKSKGTKVFALAGKIRRGGLIEVPMGTTLRQIVEEIGGGAAEGRRIKAVQIGGPSGGCVPASLTDTPVDYESLREAGAIMGSGGMVVLDDSSCMVDIARYFLQFTQDQSCGKCTFCRVGTKRMLDILDKLCAGKAQRAHLEELERLARQVSAGSLCGLGKTAPNPGALDPALFPRRIRGPPARPLPGGPVRRSCQVSGHRRLHRLHPLRPALPGPRHPDDAVRAARDRPGNLHALRHLPQGMPAKRHRGHMSTFKITIDGKQVKVSPGQTVLQAARQIGLDIPTLCHLEKCGPLTSCQVCLVKVVANGQGRLAPSCATQVAPGMVIESETEEVHEARRTALELLFSDHVGDCLSPCHRLCPLQLNIPAMIRQIEAGRLDEAMTTMRQALPLGRSAGPPLPPSLRTRLPPRRFR